MDIKAKTLQPLKYITSLTISKCKLNSSNIRWFELVPPTLQSLQLISCIGISYQDMQDIPKVFPRLKLTVQNCRDIILWNNFCSNISMTIYYYLFLLLRCLSNFTTSKWPYSLAFWIRINLFQYIWVTDLWLLC